MQQQLVIGLIGGMSWESSAEYYRIINREVQSRLGGVHSARILCGQSILVSSSTFSTVVIGAH
jgi:aspartate/glutamate racemase